MRVCECVCVSSVWISYGDDDLLSPTDGGATTRFFSLVCVGSVVSDTAV